MIFYYVPILYLFHTRLKSLPEIISWTIFYLLPIFVIGCNIVTISNVIYIILAILFVYTFYEVGYIFNDAILIKKEKNPTLRLTDIELEYVYHNFSKIMIVRTVWAILILSLFYFSGFHYISASLGGIGILLIYYFYNTTRSNFSAILYYLLISFSFCVLFMILYQHIPLLLLVMQPLLATLEYTGKKKLFNGMFTWFIAYKEYTRFIWYLVISSLIYVLPFPLGEDIRSSLLFVALMGLMFRSVILFKMVVKKM